MKIIRKKELWNKFEQKLKSFPEPLPLPMLHHTVGEIGEIGEILKLERIVEEIRKN